MPSGSRLVLVCVALCLAHVQAGLCPKTGEEPPAVRTLIASKDNPETEAWIVAPDCNVTVQKTWTRMGPDDVRLWLTDDQTPGLERIESLPSSVRLLIARSLNLSLGMNLTNAKSLQSVEIFNCSLETMAHVSLPESVFSLTVSSSKLTTLGITLPPQLGRLGLDDNSLTAMDFELPKPLQTLSMGANPIVKLEGITFPSTLTSIVLSGTEISDVRGCTFPPALDYLFLPSSEVTVLGLFPTSHLSMNTTPTSIPTTIELRESDFAALTKINATNFKASTPSSTACADPTARLAELHSSTVCVISDERFESVYKGKGGGNRNTSTVAIITSSPSPATSTSEQKESSSHTTVIVVSVLGGAVMVLLAGLGFCFWSKRRRTHSAMEDEEFVKIADTKDRETRSTTSSGPRAEV